MGERDGWTKPGGPLPNGLLQGTGPVMRVLDTDRWSKAEERTAELIDCIQPNKLSEERRSAVAHYVQRLIMNCFPCQVCTFGSVPLKTYLPDGDIDLTAFSHDQNVKDIWANQVRDMLENEEKNENAEFHVKEVQYIQAEVKIIKCLVANIVVDISFNQVGGLCTLCFLDEVDILINQNHLFKRSIILIKAWCYYESRILGAHHGLISTYALETLVLYIFHVFNNSFHGPLEVLYRFLEFFSNFDWDNFCVSLWGPVPISSLPDVTAEPPRKDRENLLLSKSFLDTCSSVYAVLPGGQENNGQPFVSKHFNVIDPLRVNNNLGRSVSKGNFFRIRSAFAFGAKRLARLLDCPKDNLIFEVNQFFMNTWDRHGSGHRPDAPRLSIPDSHDENPNNDCSGKNLNGNFPVRKMEGENIRGRGVFSQHGKSSPGMVPTTSELSSASYMQRFKHQFNSNSSRLSDKIGKDTTSDQVVLNDELQRDHLVNENQGRFLFVRTRSSPELVHTYGDVRKRQTETKNPQDTCSLVDDMHEPSKKCVDSAESNNGSNSYQWDLGLDTLNEEFSSSASLQGFDGQVHIPFNLNSAHLPFPIPPSFLASMGYSQENLPGLLPTNIPLINPSFSDVQFSHGLVSPQLTTHYFPGIGLNSPSEDSFEQNNENFCSVEINSREADNGLWQDQNVCSSRSHDPLDENLDLQSDGKKPTVAKYVPPFRNAKNVQHKNTREKRGPTCQNIDSFSIQDVRSSEVYTEERTNSLRFSSATHSSSLRSRTSSESSWDGSSVKMPKPAKQRWGKKTISTDLVTIQGKGKVMTNQTGLDDQDCGGILSNLGNEMVKRNEIAQTSGSDSVIPFAPMLIRPGSRERMNENSAGLIAFYPTGPPIPFVTMLPICNMPPETDENSENSDHSDDFIVRGIGAAETSEEKKPDILYSDLASHLQNLQFGRFCQNPQPLIQHPSPVMVPPAYLQGFPPYGRPISNNANLFSQLMTYHVVPVPNRPPNMYQQQHIEDTPRYRSGTGTYLPNPKVSSARASGNNRRGNYNNYGDREGNWNSPKSLRNHSRNQTDKSNSRADRSTPNDYSWNSSCSQNGPPNNMYPGGVSNGPSSVPQVVMFYPFDHNNATYDSHEQLEFGSRTNDHSQLNDGRRFHGHHQSSPDLPSSPHHQR